jgi:hypothetical protein
MITKMHVAPQLPDLEIIMRAGDTRPVVISYIGDADEMDISAGTAQDLEEVVKLLFGTVLPQLVAMRNARRLKEQNHTAIASAGSEPEGIPF